MGGSREAAAFHIQLKVAVDHFLYRMSFPKKQHYFIFSEKYLELLKMCLFLQRILCRNGCKKVER